MSDSLFKTGIRPAIDAYLDAEAAKVRDYGDYWSASSAGYCKRKVIMDRLQVPPIQKDARKQRVFSSGHIFHEWIQRITKDAGLSIASEVELQDEDLMIRGHFDDLVLIDGNLILMDYKTAHSKSFTYSQGRPMSYYHRMQLGTYMYMLRKDDLLSGLDNPKNPFGKGIVTGGKSLDLTEARILTISKDDLRMAEKQLFWTPELEERVKSYWTRLNDYWNKKKWPPCTCKDQESGFMAMEKYNPYYYAGEPCSTDYYDRCVKEELITDWRQSNVKQNKN